jgi:hypothetical protein
MAIAQCTPCTQKAGKKAAETDTEREAAAEAVLSKKLEEHYEDIENAKLQKMGLPPLRVLFPLRYRQLHALFKDFSKGVDLGNKRHAFNRVGGLTLQESKTNFGEYASLFISRVCARACVLISLS